MNINFDLLEYVDDLIPIYFCTAWSQGLKYAHYIFVVNLFEGIIKVKIIIT